MNGFEAERQVGGDDSRMQKCVYLATLGVGMASNQRNHSSTHFASVYSHRILALRVISSRTHFGSGYVECVSVFPRLHSYDRDVLKTLVHQHPGRAPKFNERSLRL